MSKRLWKVTLTTTFVLATHQRGPNETWESVRGEAVRDGVSAFDKEVIEHLTASTFHKQMQGTGWMERCEPWGDGDGETIGEILEGEDGNEQGD